MNVHAIDHAHVGRNHGSFPHTTPQAARPKQIDNQSPTAAPKPDTVPEDTALSKHDKHDGDKVPGVIRLLEAGHFKGVADVRLRINFFDQLSARAAAAAQPVVQDESRQLVKTVNAELDQLLSGLAVDESARERIDALAGEFDASVQAAVDQFTGNGTIDSTGLGGALRSAFDTFIEQLGELLTAPAPQADAQTDSGFSPAPQVKGTATAVANIVADRDPSIAVSGSMALGAVTAVDLAATNAAQQFAPNSTTDTVIDDPLDDPPNEPGTTIEEALAALTETFNSALTALLDSIQSATQLPDPSPPNGNGVAYDKFLAIYNELRGLTPADVDELG